RRHDPALWVLPSHKSLDAGQLPARDRDDRLVVEEEFVVGDRAFQLEALHSSPFHSVAFFGTARPSCRYARSVATRPRCVRCTKPSCSKYGSYTSSIVSASSLKAAARVSRPTGPPPNFSVIARSSLRSSASRPPSST